MKAYWIYTCDYGHRWTLFRDEDALECNGDDICPHNAPHDDGLIPTGRKAVTLSRERMLDVVQVAILPAARIVDSIKNQIEHEYEFHLVVTDRHSEEERLSKNTFTWSEVKVLLDKFRNVSAQKAWRMLDIIDKESIQQ